MQLSYSAMRINLQSKTPCTDDVLARSTPMDSTMSSVFRRPAVSATMTGKPPISSDSSRMSLVVPGIGVTIAASL